MPLYTGLHTGVSELEVLVTIKGQHVVCWLLSKGT